MLKGLLSEGVSENKLMIRIYNSGSGKSFSTQLIRVALLKTGNRADGFIFDLYISLS